jgi:hypothetical protein
VRYFVANKKRAISVTEWAAIDLAVCPCGNPAAKRSPHTNAHDGRCTTCRNRDKARERASREYVRTPKRPWTAAEDFTLTAGWESAGSLVVALLPGRTRSQARKRAVRLHLRCDRTLNTHCAWCPSHAITAVMDADGSIEPACERCAAMGKQQVAA